MNPFRRQLGHEETRPPDGLLDEFRLPTSLEFLDRSGQTGHTFGDMDDGVHIVRGSQERMVSTRHALHRLQELATKSGLKN